MPPPTGTRTVIGTVKAPRVRARIRAAWVLSFTALSNAQFSKLVVDWQPEKPLLAAATYATFALEPLAPLMGEFNEYDGGQTAISFNPLSHLLMSNDTATLFRFTPAGPTSAEMEVIWLVAEHAREGADYDVKRVSWLWNVTTRQDQTITENNQAGVMSRRYQPGPYSQMEGAVDGSVRWYLSLMSNPDNDRR